MKPFTITIDIEGTIETAIIECDRRTSTLTFEMQDGLRKTYTAYDLFVCFGMLRAEHPKIKFLCKGAKLNVHPSRMSSQMSKGLVAYELKLGKSSEEEDVVRIFDYEDENITSNIEEQISFYKKWITSLTKQ
ncbi:MULTISPECIES: hypothetical protein [Pseudomonas]|uniref:Uncharacterized protein n=1 Tax=Pseudomonas izuensis TaxID=2684212 RepID=A0ABM7RXK5_9PSED|nr:MULTISPECIES: hypothetical protein [Pseudomonas]RKS24021.1 hypothetical protein BJ917_3099 [Pseudomonas sp. WPR_5_2]BCX66922.1 hypothetical protein LAB08_R15460 [Pseudomonas izuensis]